MKIFLTILKLLFITVIGVLFFCTHDTLYTPDTSNKVSCYAFLSDTLVSQTATLKEVFGLPGTDTIHTKDSIVFVGMLEPLSGRVKRMLWQFGDGDSSAQRIIKHCFSHGGLYKGIFIIEDYAGFFLSDTVVVCVNTRPDTVKLLLPENGQSNIDPNIDTRILRWSCRDPDGDTLLYKVYFNTAKEFFSPVKETKDTAINIIEIKKLTKLTTYYWMVKAFDTYGESALSDTFFFSTKDPDATTGSIGGYAYFQGWKNHAGIKISVIDTTNLVNPQYVVTNSNGNYVVNNLFPKNYKIIAKDTIKQEFAGDTCYATVTVGMIVNVDTMVLKDLFRPEIAKAGPTGVQTIRLPRVYFTFTDKGSGILKSSAEIFVRDSNITGQASVTDTGLSWTPAQRLPDGIYGIKAVVSDSAGNASDTMRWQFTVDAMKLYAMQDTAVSINAAVYLHGKVSDVYSKVVQYKWDFNGDSLWDDSVSTTDSVISRPWTYTHEAVYKGVLYARDDSGMVKLDTSIITVGNTPPVIDAIRPDTTISIYDFVPFYGRAHDVDGKIKEYAWDFNGDGTFDYTSATTMDAGYKYISAGNYKAIIRLTDDDVKVTRDTVKVTVLQDVPQIVFFTKDTIVEHGGSVRCSVYVQQQFGTMAVEIDTANNGNFISLGSLGLAGGKTFSFTTGSACSRDSVKVRITDDDGNVVSRGFKVDIRPQSLTINIIDSTVNTITVNYSQSQETDFMEYRIYRNTTNSVDMNSELWAAETDAGVASHSTTPPSYAWEPRYYRIYQKDSEGLWSSGSNVVYGNIVNSQPTTPVIVFPVNDGDTIWANEIIRWSRCSDLNGHEVRYRVLVNYNDSGYAQFKTALIDTFVQLTGYDSLFIRWKVIAYDSEGDSSVWSAERLTHLRALVYDIDGNVYRYVTIGTQTWLVENLKTTKLNDGTPIPLVTNYVAWNNLTTLGYCWYNNDSTNKNIYGTLYNWFAVNTGKLSPAGWHVPDSTDWGILQNYLIANGYNYDGTTDSNKIAKSMAAKTNWYTDSSTGAIGNDLAMNNSSGFSALPCGHRGMDGYFYEIGKICTWWSVTEYNAGSAYSRRLSYSYKYLNKLMMEKCAGFSVRLLRD